MVIGVRIKRWRKSREMSMADLGAKIGKTSAAISQFENGDNGPSLETVEAIAKALILTMEEFFGDPPEIDTEPKKRRESKAAS